MILIKKDNNKFKFLKSTSYAHLTFLRLNLYDRILNIKLAILNFVCSIIDRYNIYMK